MNKGEKIITIDEVIEIEKRLDGVFYLVSDYISDASAGTFSELLHIQALLNVAADLANDLRSKTLARLSE